MTHIKNILVPIDFSNASQKAAHVGTLLALKFGAKLTLAHIVPSFSAFNYAFLEDTLELERTALAEARKQLPNGIPETLRGRLHTHFVVKGGNIRDELLGIVTDEQVDLVVMGTHGHGGFGRFFLGSTTESLLRRLPVPVLTVSERGTAGQTQTSFDVPFRRVLYATDRSDGSASGLHYCVDLVRALGAHLTVLYAMDVREPVLYHEEEMRKGLLARLRRLVERENAPDIDTVVRGVRGTPHDEILKVSEEIDADLIVIDLRGKGFLERMLLGSTAEGVIRTAPVPVLSIPETAPVTSVPVANTELAAASC